MDTFVGIVQTGIAAIFSFVLFNQLTNPFLKIQNKLPHLQLKWIQVLPNIRIYLRGRVIFLHHWMNFSIILFISIVIGGGILDSMLTKGVLLGGIINGFSYPDWKNIILKKDN